MSVTSTLRESRAARAPETAPVRLQLFRLLSCDRPTAPSSRHLLDDLDEVILGRGEPQAIREPGPVRRLRLKVPDPRMSAVHARLVRSARGWLLEDLGSTNGTLQGGVRVSGVPVGDGDVFELGYTFFYLREAPVAADAPADLEADQLDAPVPSLATFVDELARDYRSLARVAASGVSVLVLGETGTGKEVVARALHGMSARAGDLVAVNCGALPESLLSAELFGHRRGAFSGAIADRPGLIRAADGGTLFLDEIGELPPAPQVAFLRALQEREVVPVGDSRPVRVDFRLVAATHRDLDELAEGRAFRSDLLGRLAGLVVRIPPLRRRREDLGLLVAALLRRLPGGGRARIEPAAMRLLVHHDWPLNVRELEKTLATAVALGQDGVVERQHVAVLLRGSSSAAPGRHARGTWPAMSAVDVTTVASAGLRARLEQLLVTHDGNVAAVARAMGKGRTQIHRWARRFGMDLEAFRA